MVETSARSTQANLASDLSFIQCVVQTLAQIGPSNVQVALQTFGSVTSNTFFFNSYSSLSTLLNAISTRPFFLGGTANIANALNDMLINFYQTPASGYRNSNPHVAVLLEHGPSQATLSSSPTGTASGDAIYVAGLAKAQCIDIIGIGAYINDPNSGNYLSELSSISSSYATLTNPNYFTATSYSALNAQCSAVAQQILACVNCSKSVIQYLQCILFRRLSYTTYA